MASACRSVAMAALRSSSAGSKFLLPKISPSRSAVPSFSRPLAYVLGTMESLRPLHSAIASARLISNIAIDSSCWSLLSRDFSGSGAAQILEEGVEGLKGFGWAGEDVQV
ncbi:hypothetical protein KSP39_PZI017611 [Platanthera zijinensis]|uniref:Uncharacterized protein n=1 Tax=Platanthera zijinensis TaxID=2320716 RepID=A0AAP0B5U6_9ASPA